MKTFAKTKIFCEKFCKNENFRENFRENENILWKLLQKQNFSQNEISRKFAAHFRLIFAIRENEKTFSFQL
jgi:hypothetical protein